MAKIPSKSEEVVMSLLVRGTKEVMQAIIGFAFQSVNERKRHAKHSNPLKERMFNLGFDIVAKGGATC